MNVGGITTDQLSIYLADHHAGSTFGVELVRRARDQSQGTPYGDFLVALAGEIEEDRARRQLAGLREQHARAAFGAA